MSRVEFSASVPDAPSRTSTDITTYLAHTAFGVSMRELARGAGCHPSTVMRRVRRVENRRDDCLIDAALSRLSSELPKQTPHNCQSEEAARMLHTILTDDAETEREAQRVLRRMAEPGACLALADGMENAVVVRDAPGGDAVRTATVSRAVAEVMALREWIATSGQSRIQRYRITAPGRAALKRLVAGEESRRAGQTGQGDGFGDQHREFADRTVPDEQGKRRRVRYNMAESPMLALSRRRDKSGEPFLSDTLVAAGERLREDFELAQMGPRITQNWERFLTGGDKQSAAGGAGFSGGSEGAKRRVMDALADLGPGLGDIALRCCCFLEGLEATEKRMGWSARSGKIVLRIALQRLRQHYEESTGDRERLIG